ncbi:MAG: RidA family protein [Acidimicrobiia bacterium]
MPVEPVPTPSAPGAKGPYSPAVRAGDWIVLAGQVGLDPATGTLVEGIEAQARQVMANIAAILGDCGAALTDVAKATVFLTDMGDFPAVNEAYAAAFAGHLPARTTIGVAALPVGAEVEIEVLAYQPQT